VIASYTQDIEGIELEPFKFVGHGWMYAYGGTNKGEMEKLRASELSFEIPEVAQKKNPSSVIFKKRGHVDPAPARKRGCCGGRK